MDKYNLIVALNNGYVHQVGFMSSVEMLKVNSVKVLGALKKWLGNKGVANEETEWICKKVVKDVLPNYTLRYEDGQIHL